MEAINNIIPSLEHSLGIFQYYDKGGLKSVRFKDMYRDVCKCVDFFRELNLSSKSRVGILGTNSYQFAVIDLACLAIGAVSVPLDPNGKYDINKLTEEYCLEQIFTNILPENQLGGNVKSFDIAIKRASILRRIGLHHRFLPDDIITVKFTSGSTQMPKSIEAKAKSANSTIISIQERFSHEKNDKILVFLPLYLLQQRYWIYSAILYGFDIAVTSAVSVIRAIKEVKPSVVMGVPLFYDSMMKKFLQENSRSFFGRIKYYLFRKTGKNRFSSCLGIFNARSFRKFWGDNIKYLWSGSAPSSLETLTFYESMGIPIFQGYGMNETCIVSKNHFNNNKPGSVGKLLPNVSIDFDKDSQIIVKNKYEVNVKYYKSSAQENIDTFQNGYVVTGDLGYIDSEGYLYITGRKKNLIILSSGKKVNPEKIEKSLIFSDEIENCMVSSYDSQYIFALIKSYSRSNDKLNVKRIVEEVNKKLLPEERVLRFLVISDNWTVQNGLLTTQYKLNRKNIENKYREDISRLFSDV